MTTSYDRLATKAVVVQAGARDRYQLPLALYEDGLLEALITDLYWPAERRGFAALDGLGPFKRLASERNCRGIDSRLVHMPMRAVAADIATHLTGNRRVSVHKDTILSRSARHEAEKRQAAIFSYSYYAAEAFSGWDRRWPYRFIFQIDPHWDPIRELLGEGWTLRPETRESLKVEYELTLNDDDYQRLANEPLLANGWVAASSYTANILALQGIPRNVVHVVPYGVDTQVYQERSQPPNAESAFTILFLGSMIQRKGLAYLLDAVRLLGTRQVRLVICGRGYRDDRLLSANSDLSAQVKVALSRANLVETIQSSDVMVLPSLVEGFAHVILEAMSCGVPVITTPNTCGPDVISEGVHGFIVPIRDPVAIADKLAWGIENRQALAEMGRAAAAQARLFTWERFRSGIRQAYRAMLASAAGSHA